MEDPVAPAPEFQRRSWAIQRLGWVAIAAWLLASAIGWIGPGHGSRGRAATPDQRISIHYDRVLHQDAPSRLVVVVEREQAGTVELALGDAYVEAFRVAELVPAPTTQSAGPGGRRFMLEIDRAGPTRVEVTLVPVTWGWQTGALRIDGRPVVTLRHLVLP